MTRATDPAVRGEELTRAISGNTIERANLHQGTPSEDRYRLISEAAYRLAEKRGFAPGGELDDWLEAEREVSEARGDTAIG
jgi:Trm5-related predicted tRNA methylase